MNAVLFILALLVAVLGIPNVLLWLHRRALRWERRRQLHREHVLVMLDLAQDNIQEARRISTNPSVSVLRADTQDEIEARLVKQAGSEDPPAPPPRPRHY